MSDIDLLFQLPHHHFGPLCNRILSEFMIYHEITGELPKEGDTTNAALTKIFDAMLKSMGEENRSKLIQDANQYLADLPACYR